MTVGRTRARREMGMVRDRRKDGWSDRGMGEGRMRARAREKRTSWSRLRPRECHILSCPSPLPRFSRPLPPRPPFSPVPNSPAPPTPVHHAARPAPPPSPPRLPTSHPFFLAPPPAAASPVGIPQPESPKINIQPPTPHPYHQHHLLPQSLHLARYPALVTEQTAISSFRSTIVESPVEVGGTPPGTSSGVGSGFGGWESDGGNLKGKGVFASGGFRFLPPLVGMGVGGGR